MDKSYLVDALWRGVDAIQQWDRRHGTPLNGAYQVFGARDDGKPKSPATSKHVDWAIQHVPKDFVFVEEISSVHGVGPEIQVQLWSRGIKSLQDMYNRRSELNEVLNLGLDFYEDLLQGIDRREIDYFTVQLEKFLPVDSFIFAGSYRRGHATCDEIVLLLVKGKADLDNVIPILTEKGFLYRKSFWDTILKYNGVAKFFSDKPAHYIKIRSVEERHFYTALIHYTGSSKFNTALREALKKRKHSLSKKFVFNESRNPKTTFSPSSEEEILAIAGMSNYIDPRTRD